MKLFYTAENAKIGDVIPYYNEEEKKFDLFYLKNWNADYKGSDIVYGWHRLTTADLLEFKEQPSGIHGGTGSIIKVDGVYHMFYCTFEDNPQRQYVRHAVSSDYEQWTDIPEHQFTADGEIYALTDWRDPYVFWNEEENKWWMLLSARENAPTERNGCVGLCVSEDLIHWDYRKPLYAPAIHQSAHECPDLFKIGDWYYLVYSNYTDGFCTYYRMSRSLNGPWLRPEVDTFDGRAFYAAKTGTDGENRYIFGWNPTRRENGWKIDPPTDLGSDYRTWDWGGAMVVHKILQNPDGTLGVTVPDTVASVVQNPQSVELKPLRGEWNVVGNTASVISEGGYASLLGSKLPELCCLEATIRYTGKPTRFGIALQVDEKFAEGYYLCFEPWFNRLEFRSGLRMYEAGGMMFPYAVEMERPIALMPDTPYQIKIFIEESVMVMYINDQTAFSSRLYNYKGRQFGLFVSDGAAEFSSIRLLG
ncbi:glycoside hydrolase family 32 protein [Paenibacillus sanguinis]|uniref:glycoside hydrolase family 32 protein n=1 Tax=Paenibacillus sanguinis TaxID=225906 RepID=UPI000373D920|nr:glycoside hydrolase family 32 protein [Paenibacillus sanguinis]